MDETRRIESEEPAGGFTGATSSRSESDQAAGGEWTTGGPSGADPRGHETGREWVSQLQEMIDQLATQAAPIVREIGAKAAELAAIAGEKAGPIAHRAADVTAVAGTKVAERSRVFAADLRREAAARRAAEQEHAAASSEPFTPADSSAVADEPPVTDEPDTLR